MDEQDQNQRNAAEGANSEPVPPTETGSSSNAEAIHGGGPMAAIGEMARQFGGKVETAGLAPDRSGFAFVSFPLPGTHWVFDMGGPDTPIQHETPPAPFVVGDTDLFVARIQHLDVNKPKTPKVFSATELREMIRAAGRYAYRSASMHGQVSDIDPDALLQALEVAFMGYSVSVQAVGEIVGGDDQAPPTPTQS